MKKKILIFRHGQTDWNKERRIQGHTNTELNEQGELEAKSLSKILEEFSPEIIYSSDMNRAFKTAQIAAEGFNPQVEITQTKRLRECCFGVIEGMKVSQIKAKYGEDVWKRHKERNLKDSDISLYEGAETRKSSLDRFLNFFEEVLAAKEERIAVATHGGVLRTTLSHYEKRIGTDFTISNCVSYILNFEDGVYQGFEGPFNISEKTISMETY